ncbi:flagellar protein FlgN [Pallidibacillus pasinlerensis]|uniref:Flagellar protein FlgN n=1 Tax=Pallidibacillus pasinlerensis TaxID=2703818 RepID=A0ABX0A2F7_9BACI|nr:flagellar protein FlgN [Pallidibacillus pasinlerensis]NCU16701.1 flagellar protein FlgN [Pallidibacillus pasinlerensis]
MDFITLINILEKELTLYKSLYSVAVKKTDIVKKGDVQALNQLMTNEQKHITSITALEKQRVAELNKLFPNQTENLPTITDCIDLAQGDQKAKLQSLFQSLTDVLEKTKEQNKLNHELIKNSLQFVNFSLNLFRPKIDNFNYGPNTGKQQSNSSSIFNSEV